MNNKSITLPCIICGKELEQISSGSFNHPNNACVCRTHGNYGSRVFDPMSEEVNLEFNICDECLKIHKSAIRKVSHHTQITEIVYDCDF